MSDLVVDVVATTNCRVWAGTDGCHARELRACPFEYSANAPFSLIGNEGNGDLSLKTNGCFLLCIVVLYFVFWYVSRGRNRLQNPDIHFVADKAKWDSSMNP